MTETQLPPTAPPVTAARECLLGIQELTARFASLDLTGLDSNEIEDLLVEQEHTKRTSAVLEQVLVRQVVDRGIPAFARL